jgi:hypothetical protein
MSFSKNIDEPFDELLNISKSTIVSEDLLKSLDLSANDGLPKFKLNKPAPTGLQTSIFEQNNEFRDESDQSFVVLGKTSLESIRETSLAKFIEIQQKSDSIVSLYD